VEEEEGFAVEVVLVGRKVTGWESRHYVVRGEGGERKKLALGHEGG
jgi:hypothetical protein